MLILLQKFNTVSVNIVLCVQRKLSIIYKSTKENKILIIFIIVVKNDYSIHLSIKIYPIHKCWLQSNLIQNISYKMLRAKPLSRNMFHISFEKIQICKCKVYFKTCSIIPQMFNCIKVYKMFPAKVIRIASGLSNNQCYMMIRIVGWIKMKICC